MLQLIKEAFFKHGGANTLKSCVKAITFCATESQVDLCLCGLDFGPSKTRNRIRMNNAQLWMNNALPNILDEQWMNHALPHILDEQWMKNAQLSFG